MHAGGSVEASVHYAEQVDRYSSDLAIAAGLSSYLLDGLICLVDIYGLGSGMLD